MTAAQVLGDSDRPLGGACVKRVSTVASCCPTCAGALAWGGRGGGGAIFARVPRLGAGSMGAS